MQENASTPVQFTIPVKLLQAVSSVSAGAVLMQSVITLTQVKSPAKIMLAESWESPIKILLIIVRIKAIWKL